MALALAPAAAEVKPYAKVNGWTISRGERSCRMAMAYGGAGLNGLIINYDFNSDTSLVSFFDSSVKSVRTGDKKKLRVRFRMGNVSDDRWGKVQFVASSRDDDAGTMFTAEMKAGVLNSVATGNGVSFWYDDVLLKSYALDGSGKAVEKLRACSRDMAAANPVDPFKRSKDGAFRIIPNGSRER